MGGRKTLSRRKLRQLGAYRLAQPLRFRAAMIAIAATLPFRSFPEVQANLALATARRVHEAADHAFPFRRPLALRIIRNLIDEVFQKDEVALLPKQHAIRRTSISPRAARLLVILLDRLRQRQVNHGAHRGLVDAKAERDRSHQHPHFVRHPSFLVLPPHGRFHLPVIRDGRDPALLQIFDRLFDAANGG